MQEMKPEIGTELHYSDMDGTVHTGVQNLRVVESREEYTE